MGFRFRRRGGATASRLSQGGGDAAAVAEVLDRSSELYASDPADFDLAVAVGDLLQSAPTADIESLAASGLDDEGFFEQELRPNWEGLTKSGRAARVQSFARFANALGKDDAGGVGALVRTKVIVLAWAYDRAYGEGLLPRLAREPERFGRLELSASA
jgi:hypothetical protein